MNVKKTKSSKKIVLKTTMSMTESVRTNDGGTKASLLVGEYMTKSNRKLCSQCSIIEIHSIDENCPDK